MSELAFNLNGEAFDLPATATGWRVRRMKQRGAPEVVYGKDGVPAVCSIEAGYEELRQLVGEPGRYRLDAIDDRGRTVPDVPAAYVLVSATESDGGPSVPRNADASSPAHVMAEAMRLNTELARAVIDRFPQMVEAAANLLRAADGAGLPAREPRAVDDDEEEEEEVAPAKGFDLAALLPLAAALFGGGKMPDLASMLDWRKAAPSAPPAKKQAKLAASSTAQVEAPQGTGDDTDSQEPPPLDPAAMAHFVAIQSQLTPEESAIAREVASTLTAAELRAWIEELRELSVPDAVKKIRSLIAGKKENVS